MLHRGPLRTAGKPVAVAAGLDPVDRRILQLLREDGRVSHSAIAKAVGLSGPVVHERVRKPLLDGRFAP